jgi:two-component system chemotaxis response regulator CheB
MARYRCHTGHAYSDSALLEGVMNSTGEMLWEVMRRLEEAVMLIDHMARKAVQEKDVRSARLYNSKARELEERSKRIHDLVQRHESLSGDNLPAKEKGR